MLAKATKDRLGREEKGVKNLRQQNYLGYSCLSC